MTMHCGACSMGLRMIRRAEQACAHVLPSLLNEPALPGGVWGGAQLRPQAGGVAGATPHAHHMQSLFNHSWQENHPPTAANLLLLGADKEWQCVRSCTNTVTIYD